MRRSVRFLCELRAPGEGTEGESQEGSTTVSPYSSRKVMRVDAATA